MRRTAARSAQIGGPDGISCCFQVSSYSGEPFTSKRARNLLSKDRCRAALGDECVKSGPEVSFVGMAFPLSSARKWLTRTGAGPNRSAVTPSGEAQGVGPAADAGKEVALAIAVKVACADFEDGALVNVSGGL